jgi:hypothetical protein
MPKALPAEQIEDFGADLCEVAEELFAGRA